MVLLRVSHCTEFAPRESADFRIFEFSVLTCVWSEPISATPWCVTFNRPLDDVAHQKPPLLPPLGVCAAGSPMPKGPSATLRQYQETVPPPAGLRVNRSYLNLPTSISIGVLYAASDRTRITLVGISPPLTRPTSLPPSLRTGAPLQPRKWSCPGWANGSLKM